MIVHGIDYNKNGVYDGVLDRSDLNPQLNGETTAPALCGHLAAAKGKESNASSGEIYTAALHPQRPATDGWIEVP